MFVVATVKFHLIASVGIWGGVSWIGIGTSGHLLTIVDIAEPDSEGAKKRSPCRTLEIVLVISISEFLNGRDTIIGL